MTARPDKPAAGRLVAIDALRGIAATMVVLHHLPFALGSRPREGVGGGVLLSVSDGVSHFLHFGQSGVHLFLLLSGFCIHMQWARRAEGEESVDFLAFWKRRLHRLYPPYFVAVIASLLGLYVLYGLLAHPSPDAGLAARFGYPSLTQLVVDVALLLLLLQNLNAAGVRIGNPPFWTLALEEQLYILYFPLLWLRRRGWPTTLWVVGAVTIGWRLLAARHLVALPSCWMSLGPSRWLEWTLGALAVESYLGRVRLPWFCSSWWVGLALFALAVGVNLPPDMGPEILKSDTFCDIAFGAAYFVFLNAICRSPLWKFDRGGVALRAAASVGMFSYSLYLTHEPVIVAVKHACVRLGLGVQATNAARLVFAMVGGYVFYLLVERNFLHASRQSAAPRAALPAPPGAVEGPRAAP